MPFESLKVGKQFLVERAVVSYLPVASILRSIREPRTTRIRAPWSTQLAIFADPRFDEDVLGGPAPPLSESSSEAAAISRVFRGSTLVYTGAANRKSAFVACRAPVLHLATHAVSDQIVPERSRILFSAPAGNREADYLLLNDMYRLDLRGTELLAMSACNTESGPHVRGEGAETFGRAALAAGARSAITTLWRVEDRAAAAFMAELYMRLAHGTPKAQALRETKLRMLHSGTYLADPKHWAAFVLVGEPFDPVPQPLSWGTFIGVPGVIGLLCVALWTHSRKTR